MIFTSRRNTQETLGTEAEGDGTENLYTPYHRALKSKHGFDGDSGPNACVPKSNLTHRTDPA